MVELTERQIGRLCLGPRGPGWVCEVMTYHGETRVMVELTSGTRVKCTAAEFQRDYQWRGRSEPARAPAKSRRVASPSKPIKPMTKLSEIPKTEAARDTFWE